MGSSAPKSETKIEGGKPVIVREWLSPKYLENLSGIAQQYGERARQERATYQEMVNRNMASYGEKPLFDPMTTSEGKVIQPYQAPDIIDPSVVIDPAMWKSPKVTGGSSSGKNKAALEMYAAAINKNQNPKNTSGYSRQLES